MPEQRSEEQLAQERNWDQQCIYQRRRRRSIGAFIASTLAVFLCWWQSFELAFICAVAIMLIAVLFYYDANGHLHELRRRSKRVLSPDFSLLDKGKDSGQTSPPSANPQARV